MTGNAGNPTGQFLISVKTGLHDMCFAKALYVTIEGDIGIQG